MSEVLTDTLVPEVVTLLRLITETKAPTFAEGERAALISKLWREAGLEPHTDSVGNVLADVAGGSGARVLVAAHLDTVFAQDLEIIVQAQGDRLAAPGIGDNSASLAVLTHYLRNLSGTYPRLTVAATVGEEGLGDLYGMRQVMADGAGRYDYMVALDGHLGVIVNASVGSKRFEVQFRGRGGHSWGDFPAPSATHALGDAIAALNTLNVPREPRSSYNIGQVWGGTGINAIAEEAGFNLDLRSLNAAALARLETDALDRIRRVAKKHGLELNLKLVGDRPTANVPNRPLVEAARSALRAAGVPARLTASSTDANAAMAAGIPAISFGLYRGGDAHRLTEWLEPASIKEGYVALRALMAELAAL